MDYKEALDYINDKNKFGSRLGLDTIGKLLEFLGNPHLDMKYIHIGGTNGKGSTASYIASVLQEAGYEVGLFTSPFLERFNERISINGVDIPNDRLANITEKIKDKIEIMLEEGYEHPTTFEIVTAIAFVYFKEEQVDYVVLEVGLGGRADSTNVIKNSLASVITTIDYDHMDVLGNTLDKIAYEKAGIIKDSGLVISYPQQNEALEVLKRVTTEKQAELLVCPVDKVKIKKLSEFGGLFDFEYDGKVYEDIEISLLGEYQVYNAALALFTLLTLKNKGFIDISEEDIKKGLKKTKWKGRLEIINRDPTFVIDGAHNVQGIKNLAKNLKLFKYKRLILGLGILKDKDVEHMVEILAPLADEIIITEVNMPRKMDAYDLQEIVNKYNRNTFVEKNIKKAIDKAFEKANKDDLIIFAGSLYLIGDVRRIFIQNK
ncbi:dihydrofolate synthase/folylpolyglutamate synthase [Keratinibaculum paraultunense]|uniref:tetrahydrofolate synthase n=1 Tax=Keratinibaculum paraultunense TaxID=1278232 RepID=A0A4R3L1I2_9FIRM|nr:folylpolyglutamate synthase/dihydrofolate synthase family protein [Keratinibaculum paraultunense]QQY80349.1 bifunctional folylpolyglutamate synthase/dihydrofolate synthase [Keratinibaculum paraultunense]TCS90873.1 dihydrofolate synthase/folylpolyglutamate synthase [Keratinibaculum paraultunense]